MEDCQVDKLKCLSGATLKHIALITMLIDHTNKAVLFQYLLMDNPPAIVVWLSEAFDILGRIAFPIFAFLLVEGFYHTRSKSKYLRNLLVFAVISEIPFNMYTSAELFAAWHQNIFFTLAIGLCVIWGIDALKERKAKWQLPAIGIVILGCLAATLGEVDYSYQGVLVITLFYLFRDNMLKSLIAFIPLLRTPWAILGFATTNLYNGERGKQFKWLNYWFYPAHLLILGLIRIYYFHG